MKHFFGLAYTRLTCAVATLLLAGSCSAGDAPPPAKPPSAQVATAVFAGGCFWCAEADFEKLAGVVKAESGYTGGQLENPTYEQVSHGGTGHAEAVRVTYNPKQVSYEKLLDYFWRHIDPTVKDQQFCDVGNQYRSAIFYQNESEKKAAEASKAALERGGKFARIHTEIVPAGAFYLAEDYHQDYYKKNPIRYKYYRNSCGRDARLSEVWGAPH
ncbi:MAG: peptide-methionine (S)-S-oxide reductase MsrA [Methylotenera sp.]